VIAHADLAMLAVASRATPVFPNPNPAQTEEAPALTIRVIIRPGPPPKFYTVGTSSPRTPRARAYRTIRAKAAELLVPGGRACGPNDGQA
jgi:hypothetical protein